MYKTNHAITLIALIITIIILLILAGITINMVLGENGLFNKAKTSVAKYENEQSNENFTLSEYENLIEINSNTRNSGLGFFLGIEGTSGDGTENNPYIITTAKQLLGLSALINGGFEFNGTCFKLGKDIDLATVCSVELNKNWIPIGTTTNPFKGIFDGNGKIISNIYINNSLNNQGFFGYVNGGTIKNLIVSGSITAGTYVGGIVGNAESTTIQNCKNEVTITGDSYVGGISGIISNTNITQCANKVNISGTYSLGGLVGHISNGQITNSYSIATVTCTRTSSGDCNAGGLCGMSSNDIKISNCYCRGTVTGGQVNVAGILAMPNGSNNTIENCYFCGNVTSSPRMGSIVGWIGAPCRPITFTNLYSTSSLGTYGAKDSSSSVSGSANVGVALNTLKTYASNLGSAFKTDSNNINEGYPILSWQ